MAKVDISKYPYYDDFEKIKESTTQNGGRLYTQLLAVPGRVAQAREFTQIQSLLKDIIKSLGNSIFEDGNIIEGCQVSIDIENKIAKVTEGKVYMEGMVLPLVATEIPIEGKGTETIGIILEERIVTEEDDAQTLRDPALGYDNYDLPGCHRIETRLRVVRNDEKAIILTTLIDGEIPVLRNGPEYDVLTRTLARRTRDESGSYIVEGMNVRVENDEEDPNNYVAVVEKGKAYVYGYEIELGSASRVKVPRSTETRELNNSFVYSSSTNSGGIYNLSATPYIKEIISVIGELRGEINKTTTIANNGDKIILLGLINTSTVESVSYGDTRYTERVDYVLEPEETRSDYLQLRWITSNPPPTTHNIKIIYRYYHEFLEGVDYELYEYEDISNDTHNIRWLSVEKDNTHPVDNGRFSVRCEQYLAREDLVCIGETGEISVIQGSTGDYHYTNTPEAPIDKLTLAVVQSPPGGSVKTSSNPIKDSLNIKVSNVGLTRFTMKDIHDILDRVRTLEYDQAVISLNTEAKEYGTQADKRGIFTDPLIDLSRVDYYYNVKDVAYDVTIDLRDSICYLPTISNNYDLSYSDISTTTKQGRTATLLKTGEHTILSQNKATTEFLVNPYTKFPQLPEISIDPAVDTWIEETIIEVPKSQNSTELVSTSSRNISHTVALGGRFDSYSRSSSSTSETVIGNRVNTLISESVVSEKSIMYIRPRKITVKGSHFGANRNNIHCYFDSKKVTLTPIGATQAGDQAGSVRADSTGSFTATFMIPDNVPKGIREVRLETTNLISGYENAAYAFYQGEGTHRTIQRTVTTINTILIQRVTTTTTTTFVDPVGQTFVLDNMTMIKGINIYFSHKPGDAGAPVTCDIREVVNGTITSTILGHKTLSAFEVKVSSDSRTATRFDFDDPVLLEANREYAFVIRSTSADYRLWVAELGKNDIVTGNLVQYNPYLIGLMMSSSNNSSWTNHQTTDIKFDIIEHEFAEVSDLIFEPKTNVDPEFSRVYLLADSMIADGTSVDWYYSVDNGATYEPISPYVTRTLNEMKNNVSIKAELRRINTKLSPIVALDSVGLVLSSYDRKNQHTQRDGGYYVSHNIPGLDEYQHIDLIIDTHTPDNCKIEAYVSSNNGDSWKQLVEDNEEIRPLENSWVERTYRVDLDAESTNCRIAIKLDSANNFSTPAFRRLRAIMS